MVFQFLTQASNFHDSQNDVLTPVNSDYDTDFSCEGQRYLFAVV